MKSGSGDFSDLPSFRSDNPEFIITGGKKLLAIECPLEQRYLLIQTVTIIKLKALDVKDVNIEGIGSGKDTALRVTGDDGGWVDLEFGVLEGFEVSADELFFSEGEDIFVVESDVE